MTNCHARCAYNPEVKQRFHGAARARLRRLAMILGFEPATFDLRSNPGGVAVSGEITLHHDHVYVQVGQPATGADTGILIRACDGRRDSTGGRNHCAPLRLLDDLPALAERVRSVMAENVAPSAPAPPVHVTRSHVLLRLDEAEVRNEVAELPSFDEDALPLSADHVTNAHTGAVCRAVIDGTDLAEEKGAAVHRAALAAIRAARQRQTG
jgi:hypothetical protein